MSTGARPLIAVPAYPLGDGRVKGWHGAAVGAPARYFDALRRAGGQEALLMPVSLDDAEAGATLDHFDGLLLLGGGDLDPASYGQEPHEKVYGVSPLRDGYEIVLARAAISRAMPVLAICRGCQLLNVAFGGSLVQHLDRPGHGRPGEPDPAEIHSVTVTAGSRLADTMDATRADVSSHHHQAVDALGDGVVVVARAEDGTVEGIEVPGGGWVIGVQWHPEDTAADDPTQQRLFDTFVHAARGE